LTRPARPLSGVGRTPNEMKYVVFGIMLLFGVPAMTWLGMTNRRAREFLVALLLASTCFGTLGKMNFDSYELYRGPDRGFEVTLTDLIALSLTLVIIMRFRAKMKAIPPRTLILIVLYLICIFSVATCPMPLYGTFTLFKLVRMFVIYWCVVNALEIGVSVNALWMGIISIATIMTVLAVKQKYLYGMYRITGPFDASNSVPLYVNVILPLLLTWAVADRKMPAWKAMASMFGVLGLLLSVVASYSRAGIALAGVSLIVVLIVVNKRSANPRSIGVSILVFLLMLAGAAKAADSLAKRVKDAPKSSEEARVEFNNAAHAMLHDHSMGIGLNNFSYVLTTRTEYHRYLVVTKGESSSGVCHHIYNLTAAELGYPGLILFLLVILSFCWTAFRSSLQNRGLEASLLIGLLLGALNLHLQGFLEWGFRITPVMQIITMNCGMIIGLSRRVDMQMRPQPKRLQKKAPAREAVAVCP